MMENSNKQTWIPLLRNVISRVRLDDQHQVMADLVCSGDFPAFDGHFPGQPVLPAVIQLAVVRSLTSDVVGCALQPVRTGKLKFTGMIGPDDQVQVRIDIKREGENWSSSFRLDHAGKPVSSGKIVFGERS